MWDNRYDTDKYIFGTVPNAFLVRVTDQIPKGRVLSIAEGEGRNGVYLAREGYDVTALDESAIALEKTGRLAKKHGVSIKTITADLAEYVIEENSWDAIIAIFCHLPPDLRQTVHRQVVLGLRKGGILVLEAYTPDQLNYDTGGPGDLQLLMKLDKLKEEFEGLNLIIGQEVLRDVVDGDQIVGKSAVVQILAKNP
jgi:SAM-dependent methyltransferase